MSQPDHEPTDQEQVDDFYNYREQVDPVNPVARGFVNGMILLFILSVLVTCIVLGVMLALGAF